MRSHMISLKVSSAFVAFELSMLQQKLQQSYTGQNQAGPKRWTRAAHVLLRLLAGRNMLSVMQVVQVKLQCSLGNPAVGPGLLHTGCSNYCESTLRWRPPGSLAALLALQRAQFLPSCLQSPAEKSLR